MKNVNVRKHLRRTQSGVTGVVRHQRGLHQKDRSEQQAMSALTNAKPREEITQNPESTKVLTDEHAKHSAIREALEHVGDKLKQHRIDAEEARRKKAQANLASEKTEESKRKTEAEQRLAHEQKIAEIQKIETEVARLKSERFHHSLLGRTLDVAKRAGQVTGKAIVTGGSAGFKALNKFSNSRGSRSSYRKPKAKKHHKQESNEGSLFGKAPKF